LIESRYYAAFGIWLYDFNPGAPDQQAGVTVEIPLSAKHPHRRVIENATLNCPVKQSLSAEMEIPVTFLWRDDL